VKVSGGIAKDLRELGEGLVPAAADVPPRMAKPLRDAVAIEVLEVVEDDDLTVEVREGVERSSNLVTEKGAGPTTRFPFS
jgi:hypothetical protein